MSSHGLLLILFFQCICLLITGVVGEGRDLSGRLIGKIAKRLFILTEKINLPFPKHCFHENRYFRPSYLVAEGPLATVLT